MISFIFFFIDYIYVWFDKPKMPRTLFSRSNGFDLVKRHRENIAHGPQLIFVVSWLCYTFVVCSRITKCTKKRVSLRPIYSLGLHISGYGMRDVAKMYLRVHAGLSVHILIEETAAIGHTRYLRIFNV